MDALTKRVSLAGLALACAAASTSTAQGVTVEHEQEISLLEGAFGGQLDAEDLFGDAVAFLGDLDGDGVGDLAVGAPGDDDGPDAFVNRGAVWILFLNADGTVEREQKISARSGGFGGTLDVHDAFGDSLAYLGDLDGDGTGDLAVGAPRDDDGGFECGAVWILFLETDGTVKAERKISALEGGFGGALIEGHGFGTSLAFLDDLDGDGIADLAVGAPGQYGGGQVYGSEWILFLDVDGTVQGEHKIDSLPGTLGLYTYAFVGFSAASVGDLDGDGAEDLALGIQLYDAGTQTLRGAAWMLFLDRTGHVLSGGEIPSSSGALLQEMAVTGPSVARVGDLDGDGVEDLAVGTPTLDGGSVHVLLLEGDASVKAEWEISEASGGFGGDLAPGDLFGCSVATLGDFDDDGVDDLAVGARGAGGSERGAAWVLFLGDVVPPEITCSDVTVEGQSSAGTIVHFAPTVFDSVDSAPEVACVPPSGSLFPLGVTTVTCTAVDYSGNLALSSFDVTVVDTTPPSIACPEVVMCMSATFPAPATFSIPVTDLCDPAPTLVCTPPSGSLFPWGYTHVTCTATDAAGNTAHCSFRVLMIEFPFDDGWIGGFTSTSLGARSPRMPPGSASGRHLARFR